MEDQRRRILGDDAGLVSDRMEEVKKCLGEKEPDYVAILKASLEALGELNDIIQTVEGPALAADPKKT